MSKPKKFLWLLLLAAVSLYALRILARPAFTPVRAFAAYYTAARLLVASPQTLPQAYDNDWFAAQIQQTGFAGIYDVFSPNPPTMTLLALPLAWLPPAPARWLWNAASLSALIGGLLLLCRILRLPTAWLPVLLALAFLYTPARENFRSEQAYALLFFCLCVALWGSQQSRPALAGLGLGLMAALKTAGAWLWPLLLASRRWKELVWATAVAGAAALITLLLAGPAAWLEYLARLPAIASDPKRTVTAYQTVSSLSGHLFDYDTVWNPNPVLDAPWLAGALTLAVLAAALLVSARFASAHHEGDTRLLALAMICALLVTNAPYAEDYHYILLLPSLSIAAWWAWNHKPGWQSRAWLALAALLLGAPLPYEHPALAVGGWALLAYPRVYGGYLLWGWLSAQLLPNHDRRQQGIER